MDTKKNGDHYNCLYLLKEWKNIIRSFSEIRKCLIVIEVHLTTGYQLKRREHWSEISNEELLKSLEFCKELCYMNIHVFYLMPDCINSLLKKDALNYSVNKCKQSVSEDNGLEGLGNDLYARRSNENRLKKWSLLSLELRMRLFAETSELAIFKGFCFASWNYSAKDTYGWLENWLSKFRLIWPDNFPASQMIWTASISSLL